jgi:SAM-dependent methyltransferase
MSYNDDIFTNRKTRINSPRVKKIVGIVNKISPYRVIDLGCGSGEMAASIGYPSKIDGVECCAAQRSIAIKSLNKVYCDDLNGSLYDIENNTYDLSLSCGTIEHLIHPEIMVAEMYRVTKSGGNIVINCPNLCSWFNRMLVLIGWQPYATEAAMVELAGNPFGWRFGQVPVCGHLHNFNSYSLVELVKKAGFVDIKIKSTTSIKKHPFDWIDIAVGWIYPRLGGELILIAKKP